MLRHPWLSLSLSLTCLFTWILFEIFFTFSISQPSNISQPFSILWFVWFAVSAGIVLTFFVLFSTKWRGHHNQGMVALMGSIFLSIVMLFGWGLTVGHDRYILSSQLFDAYYVTKVVGASSLQKDLESWSHSSKKVWSHQEQIKQISHADIDPGSVRQAQNTLILLDHLGIQIPFEVQTYIQTYHMIRPQDQVWVDQQMDVIQKQPLPPYRVLSEPAIPLL